jgi:plastocyanin domain-containing protein
MEIKKTTVHFWGVLILVVVGGYFMLSTSASPSIENNMGNEGNGPAQEIVFGMKNYNYFPESVIVNAGQPVRIKLDSTAQGCFRDFTIRDLGVRKYLASNDDYVEFTPTQPGTYTFACSMGMGFGKLIVQ